MGAAARPLTSLEIPVGRAGATLPWLQLVRVHAQTHRAARLAPLEPGLTQDAIQPLRLGLLLHRAGPGHHHGAHARRYLSPARNLSGGADVLDAAIRATTDEHHIHGQI